MSRVVYVDGRYLPTRRALVSAQDRGFQFADGVYEVWGVAAGALQDAEGHFARLERSLAALEIPEPMSRAALSVALRETLRRNHVRDGLVYLQITRGAAARDHAFPNPPLAPTVTIAARAIDPRSIAAKRARGVRVISAPDQRWARCDIKTVGLLPNVLAKEAAKRQGAVEAWLVDASGLVTEGAASTAWIVTHEGRLVTRELGANILPGVTRARVVEIAASLQIPIEERGFTLEEAKGAAEAFITSATNPVTPVIAIDAAAIGAGAPGPITRKLGDFYVSGRLAFAAPGQERADREGDASPAC